MKKFVVLSASLIVLFFSFNTSNAQDAFTKGKEAYNKGNYNSAIDHFREAVKKVKNNPELYYLLGESLFKVNHLDSARIVFFIAKELDPNNLQIYTRIGDIYAKQNVHAAAIDQYLKAIELDSTNLEAHVKLATSYKYMRRWNDAVNEYWRAISLDSTNAELYAELGRIYFLAKLYKNASQVYQKLSDLKPNSVEVQALAMKSAFESDNFGDAIKYAQKVLDLGYNSSDSMYVATLRIMISSYEELKDYPSIESTIQKLSQKVSLTAKDYATLGKAQLRQDKKDLALNSFETAIKMDSSLTEIYSDLGSLYIIEKRYQDAALMYEKKLEVDPSSISAYINASNCYVQLKNYERSRQLLLKALDVKPVLMAKIRLAQTYALMDSTESAKDQYIEVINSIGDEKEKYNDELNEAYNQLVILLFLKGSYGQVLDWGKKAIASGVDNSDIRTFMGQSLLLLKGSLKDAEFHFRKAVQYNSKNVNANLGIAMSLIMQRVEGDDENNKKLKEEACKYYRIVLALDPRNQEALKAVERYSCK